MTWVWRPFLLASGLTVVLLGYHFVPMEWKVPVSYGIVILALWVSIFMGAYMLRK